MTGTQALLIGSDLYGVAYLAGGPRRVVETAVVALVDNGRLRVDRATGRLHVVDDSRRQPVEAVVLDAVGPRGRSVWEIVWRARSDPRLAAVADGLARNGLLTRRGGVDAREPSFWTLSGLTRAGRAALRQVRQSPPSPPSPPATGGNAALAVALAGPSAWGAELHTAVFDPPPPGSVPSSPADARAARYRHVPYVGPAGWGGGFGGDCGGGGDGGGGGC